MSLSRLAWALVAMSVNWAALANPAINSNVSGSATQIVAGQQQARLDGRLSNNLSSNLGNNLTGNLPGNDGRALPRSSTSAAAIDESIPRGWLMALVAVLLIGHQLRRKHRFLRPHRFSDL